jgi:hypothetical protein
MQTPDKHEPPEEALLQAPPKLAEALRQLPWENVFVPPTVDEAVLRAARRHLAAPARPRWNWFRLMRWAAATASLVALTLVAMHYLGPQPGVPPAPALAREDLNHDGRVDILDAFALARQLKAGGKVALSLDINGDGLVDERDVAALAAQAVRLSGGNRP